MTAYLFYFLLGLHSFLFLAQRIKPYLVKLPSLERRFLTGTMHHLPKDMRKATDFSRRILRDIGDMGMTRVWVGPVCCVEMFEPDLIKAVLSTSTAHLEKSVFYKLLEQWLGAGLLLSKGEKWLSRRRLITPTFHFDILRGFAEIMNEHGNHFVAHLDKSAGSVVDIFEVITRSTLDIIAETAMGCRLHGNCLLHGVFDFFFF